MKERLVETMKTREAREILLIIAVLIGEGITADKTLANLLLLAYKLLFMVGIMMFGKYQTVSMLIMFAGSILYKVAGSYSSIVNGILSEGTGTLVIYAAGACWCICKAVHTWVKDKEAGKRFKDILWETSEFRKSGKLIRIQFWGLLILTTFGLVYMQGSTTGRVTFGGVMTSAWVSVPVFAAIAMVIRLWESYILRAFVCLMSIALVIAEALNGVLDPMIFAENVICLTVIIAEAIVNKPKAKNKEK